MRVHFWLLCFCFIRSLCMYIRRWVTLAYWDVLLSIFLYIYDFHTLCVLKCHTRAVTLCCHHQIPLYYYYHTVYYISYTVIMHTYIHVYIWINSLCSVNFHNFVVFWSLQTRKEYSSPHIMSSAVLCAVCSNCCDAAAAHSTMNCLCLCVRALSQLLRLPAILYVYYHNDNHPRMFHIKGSAEYSPRFSTTHASLDYFFLSAICFHIWYTLSLWYRRHTKYIHTEWAHALRHGKK